MGVGTFEAYGHNYINDDLRNKLYDPLHDDAQAMALVKKFGLDIGEFSAPIGRGDWGVSRSALGWSVDWSGRNSNLNRAIVECVAKMQQAKA
jgi:hypothetical protein